MWQRFGGWGGGWGGVTVDDRVLPTLVPLAIM